MPQRCAAPRMRHASGPRRARPSAARPGEPLQQMRHASAVRDEKEGSRRSWARRRADAAVRRPSIVGPCRAARAGRAVGAAAAVAAGGETVRRVHRARCRCSERSSCKCGIQPSSVRARQAVV
eukprot:350375-Chlamydomonas_euryale.AAC.2